MLMISKFSNLPDELSKNDELREYELSGSDYTVLVCLHICISHFNLNYLS